jgi:formate dehydrogenase iron-sulfur subunit
MRINARHADGINVYEHDKQGMAVMARKQVLFPVKRARDIEAESAAVGSFYHLYGLSLDGRRCNGLACFAARNDEPDWHAATSTEPFVYCLGKCYRAPADADQDSRPLVEVHARETVLLDNVCRGGVRDLAAYRKNGGGDALARTRSMPPAAVIGQIDLAGLRGRGGAGFPAGRKWQAVAAEADEEKYVVANADEGDPGSFSDRFLMEDDPFLLIEGMAIAAHAVGARRGFIYLRKEYARAGAVLDAALKQARESGWLSGEFDIELVAGHGSYLCGEETSMLNALEGRRPEVRPRPPQITQRGLYGRPTLVNNVETLCSVPWILRNGGEAYARLGFSRSRGTKLLSLNSLFRRPGLYEVEFGIALRDIVERLGGGLRRGRLLGVMVGGPLAGLLPPAQLDLPLAYEELQAAGAAVGHGGVIAFADDTSIPEIVEQLFRFGAYESCGKCTPCRLGSLRIERMFSGVVHGQPADRDTWSSVIHALAQASLCGHGRGLAEFARSIERYYPEELAACFG